MLSPTYLSPARLRVTARASGRATSRSLSRWRTLRPFPSARLPRERLQWMSPQRNDRAESLWEDLAPEVRVYDALRSPARLPSSVHHKLRGRGASFPVVRLILQLRLTAMLIRSLHRARRYAQSIHSSEFQIDPRQ